METFCDSRTPCVLIGPAGFTCNESASLEVLHTNATFSALHAFSNDGIQDIAFFSSFLAEKCPNMHKSSENKNTKVMSKTNSWEAWTGKLGKNELECHSKQLWRGFPKISRILRHLRTAQSLRSWFIFLGPRLCVLPLCQQEASHSLASTSTNTRNPCCNQLGPTSTIPRKSIRKGKLWHNCGGMYLKKSWKYVMNYCIQLQFTAYVNAHEYVSYHSSNQNISCHIITCYIISHHIISNHVMSNIIW